MSPGRILIIEDDDSIRECLLEILETEGYQVLQARNGQEGLDLLENSETPDLILLDMTMPVMNGEEFLKQKKARQKWDEVPTVVFTAAGVKNRPTLASEFLKKPVPLEAILGIAEKYCLAARSSSKIEQA